jgi:hypothetical protein
VIEAEQGAHALAKQLEISLRASIAQTDELIARAARRDAEGAERTRFQFQGQRARWTR